MSTWRSGSTFLEDLISSYPGTYNHFEPLNIHRLRNFYDKNESESKNAQNIVRKLLDCEYDEKYIKSVRKLSYKIFKRNRNLWNKCFNYLTKENFCYDKKFLEETCKSHSLLVMKLARLGVGLIYPIIKSSLNIHVLFLVRDPRAVMNSRTRVDWCKFSACSDPSIHCNHLEQDIKELRKLKTLYPDKITLVRYEDVALLPLESSKAILKGLGLGFPSEVRRFIDEHTKKNIDSPMTTTRVSSKHVLLWTKSIDKKTLVDVQSSCSKVMKILGYKPVESLSNLAISNILDKLQNLPQLMNISGLNIESGKDFSF
ncbi:UNVERIFIED_CONTAM: hypothetical protein RMT77_003037 [Armadillidium vulgare]